MIALTGPDRVPHDLRFRTLGHSFSIRCDDVEAADLLAFRFAAMRIDRRDAESELVRPLIYEVGGRGGERFALVCPGNRLVECEGVGAVVHELEHDLTIALQRARPDLFFVHAAALEHAGRAYLLAGDSGNGKSTTAWGLLNRGFNYLSDELSPIDVATLCVHAYPRALSLKAPPPASQPLPPAGVRHLESTLQIGAGGIPTMSGLSVCPIESIVFVRYEPQRAAPALRKVSAAEAGARLYAMTLNALAHVDQGFGVALQIASHLRCYVLESADLADTCDLFHEQVLRARPSEV